MDDRFRLVTLLCRKGYKKEYDNLTRNGACAVKNQFKRYESCISPEPVHSQAPSRKRRVMVLLNFLSFFFQSGAVFLAICYISKLKSLIGVLFAAFWIPDLLAICCILELKSLICMLFAAFLDYNLSCISEPKSQIWVAKIVHLHENCNIFPGFSTMSGWFSLISWSSSVISPWFRRFLRECF